MSIENNKIILDIIDNIVKLSDNFDKGFKTVFELEPGSKIDSSSADILYSMTKNYILIRKEHGELLLMMNNLLNSQTTNEKTNKKDSKKSSKSSNVDVDNGGEDFKNIDDLKVYYDISTFNTLLNNINDLINNIDFEYKKIALKFPKFINAKPMNIILISTDATNKYFKMIEELKQKYIQHKFMTIVCTNDKNSISKCNEELKKFNIKIKSFNSLPLIYIINGNTITEIPINKIGEIEGLDPMEPIKNLID